MEDRDYDEVLNEAKMNTIPDGDFEAEVFLSTDGKNTVHVKADTREGRKASLIWAKEVYDRLKETYGTKQAQAVKEYSKDNDAKSVCQHPEDKLERRISNSEKNKGRAYMRCTLCNSFIRFV